MLEKRIYLAFWGYKIAQSARHQTVKCCKDSEGMCLAQVLRKPKADSEPSLISIITMFIGQSSSPSIFGKTKGGMMSADSIKAESINQHITCVSLVFNIPARFILTLTGFPTCNLCKQGKVSKHF